MSKSKIDIFVAIAGKLRDAFRINGQSTDGTQDVIIEKLGLSTDSVYTPVALYTNDIVMDSGYIVFRTLGSNVDGSGNFTVDEHVTCTCTLGLDAATLMVVSDLSGDVYIYTADNTDIEWTLKSKVGRADGAVAEAERLATGRKINGVTFDGTQDVTTLNWGPSVDFALSGDVSGSVTGQRGTAPVTINATLNSSGVAAGTYGKVTVDVKGRVTGGSQLVASDIPYLTASHISSGLFGSDRIPFLPAEKITSGVFANERLTTRAVTGTLAQLASKSTGSTRVKIRLPWTMYSHLMVSFRVTVYNAYILNTFSVSGYLYATGEQWYLPKVHLDSDTHVAVLVGRDPDGIAYVSVPVADYHGIRVHDLTIGYTEALDTDSRNNSWSITADVTVPNSITPTFVTNIRSDNIGAYIAGGAAYLTTARTINGGSFNGTQNIVTTYWGPGRSLTLSGDVTGTVWWDGGANVSMAVSLAGGTSPKTATWLGANNLNNITSPGFYYNDSDAQALPSLNYPQHHAGSLRVYMAAGIVQEYTTYSGGGPEKYVRGLYNGGWSAWRRLASNANVNDLVTVVHASKMSGVLNPDNIPSIPSTKVSGLGNLASRTIYISTAEPNNATGAEGDLWGVIQ